MKTKLENYYEAVQEDAYSDGGSSPPLDETTLEPGGSEVPHETLQRKRCFVARQKKESPEFLTAPETARLLRISRRTLKRLCAARLLPHIILRGKFLFRRASIDLFLSMREVCFKKGATIVEPLNWSPRKRDQKTGRVVGAAAQHKATGNGRAT